jgi:hypothetical protein
MNVIAESLHFVESRLFHSEKKKQNILLSNTSLEISQEQQLLISSIKKKARVIGDNVRLLGEQEFGPMWAQGYTVLPDERIVFLQHGIGDAYTDEEVIINIQKTAGFPYLLHFRYNLTKGVINTYEIRREDGCPIVVYGIFDRPEDGVRFPKNLTDADIITPVDCLLQVVGNVTNTIQKNMPIFKL